MHHASNVTNISSIPTHISKKQRDVWRHIDVFVKAVVKRDACYKTNF
jgi:uncharacterized protein (DUF779 family)